MRTWAKVAAGILAALALLCVLGGVLLVATGTWDRMREFGGGVFGISKTAKDLEAMDRRFPFEAPGDGIFSEERLMAYIEVRRVVKVAADPYDAWLREHEGQQGDLGDAREAIRLTGAVMEALRRALEEQAMSPAEFAWLDRRVREAEEELRGAGNSSGEDEAVSALRDLSRDPRLTGEERRKLEGILRRSAPEGSGSGAELSPNAELCLRHGAELEATRLGEMGGQMVRGFAQSGGRKGHRGRS